MERYNYYCYYCKHVLTMYGTKLNFESYMCSTLFSRFVLFGYTDCFGLLELVWVYLH